MQLTLALGVPGQLWVLGAGLCLDAVNHSILLSGQHSLHMSLNVHRWDFSTRLFTGTHLNTCNRESTEGL